MNSDHCVILSTFPTEEEARTCVEKLLQQKLIACGNVTSQVTSVFWWEGQIDRASEFLVLLKTKSSLFASVKEHICQNHSYDVPEVIALPVIIGSENYLKWIDTSVDHKGGSDGRY